MRLNWNKLMVIRMIDEATKVLGLGYLSDYRTSFAIQKDCRYMVVLRLRPHVPLNDVTVAILNREVRKSSDAFGRITGKVNIGNYPFLFSIVFQRDGRGVRADLEHPLTQLPSQKVEGQ